MTTTWKTGFPTSNQGPNRNINDDENGLNAYLQTLGLVPPSELVTTIETEVGGGGYLTRQDLIDYSMLDASDNVLLPVLAAQWSLTAAALMNSSEVAWDTTNLPAPYTALVQPKFHITNPTLTDIICDEAGLYQITVNDVWTPDGGAISPYNQIYEILYQNATVIAQISEIDWVAGENGCSFSTTRRLAVNDVLTLAVDNSTAVRNGNSKTTIVIYKIAD
jgi:hypothetical protein